MSKKAWLYEEENSTKRNRSPPKKQIKNREDVEVTRNRKWFSRPRRQSNNKRWENQDDYQC